MRTEKIFVTPDTISRIRDMRALHCVGCTDDQVVMVALNALAKSIGYTFDDWNNCVPYDNNGV